MLSEPKTDQQNRNYFLSTGRFLFPLIIWCLGVTYFYSEFFISKFDLISGNLGDNRLIICLHEHWYNVFRGRNHWSDPLFFFPAKHVLGYSDAFFLNSFIYSLIRLIGGDEYISFQITLITINLIGFFSCYYLCKNCLGMATVFSTISSAVFAFSSVLYMYKFTAQCLSIYYMPLVLVLLFSCMRALRSNPFHASVWGAGASVLMGLLFFTSYNVSWFFIFFLAFTSLWLLLIENVKILKWPNKKILTATGFIFIGFMVSLIPFFATYLPLHLEGFKRTFDSAIPHLLSFSDYANFSSPIWEKLLDLTGNRHLIGSKYQIRSPAPGMIFLFVIFGALLLKRLIQRSISNIDKIFMSVFFAGVVGWLCILKEGDFSLWKYISLFIPGASANRVAFRFQIVIGMFCTIFVFYYIKTAWHSFSYSPRYTLNNVKSIFFRSILLALCLFLVIEQYSSRPNDSFSRSNEIARLSVPRPHLESDAFFLIDPEGTLDRIPHARTNWYYIYKQIDAMLIAQKVGLPTINGYSGWLPKGWIFMYPEKNPVYFQQVSAWLEKHSFAGKVIALDMTNKTWINEPFKTIMDLSEVNFKMSKSTPHIVGRFEKGSNEIGVMHAKNGESGVLVFGPYIPLHPGRYRVVFKIDARGASSENSVYGTIDVNRVTEGQIVLKVSSNWI